MNQADIEAMFPLGRHDQIVLRAASAVIYRGIPRKKRPPIRLHAANVLVVTYDDKHFWKPFIRHFGERRAVLVGFRKIMRDIREYTARYPRFMEEARVVVGKASRG